MNETAQYTGKSGPLEDLRKLVEYSKLNPTKFDWTKNLNDWQKLFTNNILAVYSHIPGMVPSEKQLAPILQILDRMTLVTSEP